ncbi:unnamed protein product, partial [Ectocarpus fasciculatus]
GHRTDVGSSSSSTLRESKLKNINRNVHNIKCIALCTYIVPEESLRPRSVKRGVRVSRHGRVTGALRRANILGKVCTMEALSEPLNNTRVTVTARYPTSPATIPT